ncbi:MAG: Gfo/Idh/MocA family oxidoreductase [Ignavibacteriaceae bacterium]
MNQQGKVRHRFALTGVAGYVAPRHLKAIKDTGSELVAALDPHDSVGVLDSFFPNANFFTEYERFDRHLEKLRRGPITNWVNFISICSPSHLHDAHVRLALRLGAHAICEKPLVLSPWNLDALQELEGENPGKISTVLQLRLHPSLIELKKSIENRKYGRKFKVQLTYITSRGMWYNFSWKGMKEKSGGIATNIGIHFFDLLIWLFGGVQSSAVHYTDSEKAGGFLELKDAEVQWFLSIDSKDLPAETVSEGKSIYRSIKVDGEEVQFSEDFTDLHTKVYEEVIAGRGFGIDEARPSIELAYRIRNSELSAGTETTHPLVKKILRVEDYINELL